MNEGTQKPEEDYEDIISKLIDEAEKTRESEYEPSEEQEEPLTEKEIFLKELYANWTKSTSVINLDEYKNKLISGLKIYKEKYNKEEEDRNEIKELEEWIGFLKERLEATEKLKSKSTEQEKKNIERKAILLQFKYSNSLFAKLFRQRSHHNWLYGQALYHILLGIICKCEFDYRGKTITKKPSLFYIQQSRSGKNEGMYFIEEILKNLKHFSGRDFLISRMGKSTDPTLLDRPVVIIKKGKQTIMRDDEGQPIITKGTLSKNDLIWYPEADFLLNPTSKDNMEAINIHLNLLESKGEYKKELVQWQGEDIITKGGKYSLVALTRPIENIKKHIIYSGFLQRCIFIPRMLTEKDRKAMLDDVTNYSLQKQNEIDDYKNNFDNLIIELKDIQKFSLNKIIVDEKNKEAIKSKINESINKLFVFISTEIFNEENKEIFSSFFGNYNELIIILSYHSALTRRSLFIEEEDINYSIEFLIRCLDEFIPWIEENIQKDNKLEVRDNYRVRVMKEIVVLNYGKVLSIPEFRRIIQSRLKISQPTADKLIIKYSEQPYNLYHYNTIDRSVCLKS